MKSSDQQLLEEAYNKTLFFENVTSSDKKIADEYYENFAKFKKGEISKERWNEICSKLLSDIMEKHKDVFVRLKNR